MYRLVLVLIFIFLAGARPTAAEGLQTVASKFDLGETITRLESAIKAKGMTEFARIDHAAGAKQAGLTLRPTTVVIFGAAKAGTPLMQAEQTMGIDLPLKALVWQDAAGKTWISYNDPEWLARRHGLGDKTAPIIVTMGKVLREVTWEAAGTK
jgi:uncharacterized protein (DUF302 family)